MGELVIRHGPPGPASILFVAPLFDEANRLRRTLVEVMRGLAARGLSSALPDLPGQNESLVPSDTVRLADWRTALAGHADPAAPPLVVSLRGGALIDDAVAARGCWRLAPVDGATLVRAMRRTQLAGEREAGGGRDGAALDAALTEDKSTTLAGVTLGRDMWADLGGAKPATVAPCRVATLGSAPDALPGRALWLAAEPGEDRALIDAMVADIADWSARCAAT